MFVGSMGCQGFLALKNKASMWKSCQVLQDLEGLFKDLSFVTMFYVRLFQTGKQSVVGFSIEALRFLLRDN